MSARSLVGGPATLRKDIFVPFVMASTLATPPENKSIQDITSVQVSIVAVCGFLRTSSMPAWIFEMASYKTSHEHIRMIFFLVRRYVSVYLKHIY